jgi:hypothetical protein
MVLQFGQLTESVQEPMPDTFALWDGYFENAHKTAM